VELTALSRIYNVSFTVISRSGDMMLGDPSAPENIMLAYSNGNHYDLVLSRARVQSLVVCQKILFDLVQSLHDTGKLLCGNLFRMHLADPAPSPPSPNVEQPWTSSSIGARGLRVPRETHVYQNLGLHSWLNSMRELSESDELVCLPCRSLSLYLISQFL
jgi:hypothetical protein